MPVGQHKKRHFGSGQTFLDDQRVARVAKLAVDQSRPNGSLGLVASGGNDDTFAPGQAIRLDHDREAEGLA
ncbi:hypothetical protein D3C83_234620 [compost metagenome]